MKSKYQTILVVISTVLAVTVMDSVVAITTPVIDKKSTDFRDLQGFSKAAQTDDEMKELLFRAKLSHQVEGSIIDAANNGFIFGFAGSYIDTPKGKLKIGLVNDDQQTKIINRVPQEYKDRIEFYHADYTPHLPLVILGRIVNSIDNKIQHNNRISTYARLNSEHSPSNPSSKP